MDDFFKHENAKDFPALALKGKLCLGAKSQVLQCLPGLLFSWSNALDKQAKVVIFDMPAIIHIIKSNRANNFAEYINLQLLPYIESESINAVWDKYKKSS